MLEAACCPSQVNIPLWALVHFPVIVTITTAMFTPKACPSACARPAWRQPRCNPRVCLLAGGSAAVPVQCWVGASSQCAVVDIVLASLAEHYCTQRVACQRQGNQHCDRPPACHRLRMTVRACGMQGWLHCILYVLFENAMGIVKLWACVAGASPIPAAVHKFHMSFEGIGMGEQ